MYQQGLQGAEFSTLGPLASIRPKEKILVCQQGLSRGCRVQYSGPWQASRHIPVLICCGLLKQTLPAVRQKLEKCGRLLIIEPWNENMERINLKDALEHCVFVFCYFCLLMGAQRALWYTLD